MTPCDDPRRTHLIARTLCETSLKESNHNRYGPSSSRRQSTPQPPPVDTDSHPSYSTHRTPLPGGGRHTPRLRPSLLLSGLVASTQIPPPSPQQGAILPLDLSLLRPLPVHLLSMALLRASQTSMTDSGFALIDRVRVIAYGTHHAQGAAVVVETADLVRLQHTLIQQLGPLTRRQTVVVVRARFEVSWRHG